MYIFIIIDKKITKCYYEGEENIVYIDNNERVTLRPTCDGTFVQYSFLDYYNNNFRIDKNTGVITGYLFKKNEEITVICQNDLGKIIVKITLIHIKPPPTLDILELTLLLLLIAGCLVGLFKYMFIVQFSGKSINVKYKSTSHIQNNTSNINEIEQKIEYKFKTLKNNVVELNFSGYYINDNNIEILIKHISKKDNKIKNINLSSIIIIK